MRNLATKVVRKFGLMMFRVRASYSDSSKSLIQNGGVLVCSNHVSLIDGIIIALSSPKPMLFGVTTEYSRRPSFYLMGLKFLEYMQFGEVVPIDSSSPYGIRRLSKGLSLGQSVMVFPEGQISLDGHPMPSQPGVDWLIAKSNPAVVNVRITGAEKSKFFAKSGTSLWPKIHVEFL